MISLRTITRVLLAAGVLSMGFALAGCEDPKIMAMFDGKKKLPGERKEVFPGGNVPGIQQGVPPELMKGYQPPPEERSPEPAAETTPPPQPARVQQASAAPAPRAEVERGKILVGNAASGVTEPPKPKKKVARPKPQPVAAAPQGGQPYTPPAVQQQQPAQQPQQDSAAPTYSQPRAWPGGR